MSTTPLKYKITKMENRLAVCGGLQKTDMRDLHGDGAVLMFCVLAVSVPHPGAESALNFTRCYPRGWLGEGDTGSLCILTTACETTSISK